MLKRQKQVSIRLTEQEYDQLCKKAKSDYLKREPYIRRLIDELYIEPRRPDEYLSLVADISVIGKRVNEIAHTVNRNWYVTEAQITELTQLLQEVQNMIHAEADKLDAEKQRRETEWRRTRHLL